MSCYAQFAAANYNTPPVHSQKQRGHHLCDQCGAVETPATQRFRLCSGCMTTQYCSLECQKRNWPSHKAICQHTQASLACAKQQPVSSSSDEIIAKPLRKFTSAHTALLGWAGFQALQLKRLPSNIQQNAFLVELTPKSGGEPHRRFSVLSTHIVSRKYIRDPLVLSDIQRREERCRHNGGIGTLVIIIQCGGISQVMPVEVDSPAKISWDVRDDWENVLSHFVDSGRTDFIPISTNARGDSFALPTFSGELEAWNSRDHAGLASTLLQTDPEHRKWTPEETQISVDGSKKAVVSDHASKLDGRSPIDLEDKFPTSTSSIWKNPPPHSASLAPSISTSTKHDNGEMRILNANSESDSEAITAICGSQCEPDSERAFTEQHVFSYTTAQQPKSRARLLDICHELGAPPLLDAGDAGLSGSLPSPPQSLSDTLQSSSCNSEEGHEEWSHSEPYYLVEQSIVLPSEMACTIERKLGPFDQSRAPGSSPELVGEVPDPPNFGHFLGITTPQIPTRHFSSDWMLSLHHDWGWLLNIGGEKAPALDKRDISRFISRLLAEWASSSPGAFNNANGFGIHGSSFANAQNVHYTINNYWPGPTGNLGQSLRDLNLQQQIEQLQKQLEDERMIRQRNEDRNERALSDIRQSLHRLETRLPPGPEPPPDKPEQRKSTDEGIYFDIRDILNRIESSLPSLPGRSSEQELQGNPDRRICVQSHHTVDSSPHTFDFSIHDPKAQQTPAVQENPRRTKSSRFSHSSRRQYRYHPYGRPRSERNSRVSVSPFSIHDVSEHG